jgi:hypothetical protein
MGLSDRGLKRGFFWMASFIFVAANVSSFSRGGFVGMMAVGLLCLLRSKHKIRSLAIFAVVAFAFIRFVPEEYKVEMRTIQEEGWETGTGRGRVEFWKIAWQVFLSHPFIGVGQGNIPWVIAEYEEWGGSSRRSAGGRVAHSIYFTVLPELGILGASLTILILIYVFSKSKELSGTASRQADAITKSDCVFLRYAVLGMTIGLAGYLVSGIFLSAFYYPGLWNVMGLIVAASRISKQYNADVSALTVASRC